MRILITAPFTLEYVEELRKDHKVIFEPWSEDKDLLGKEELKNKLMESQADIFVCESEVITAEVLREIEDLKLICVCRAGLNDVDLDAASQKKIMVTNTPGRNANAVAEMTVALLVMLSRNLVTGEHALRRGEWDDSLYFSLRGIELSNRTIGFLGFGAVPRALAQKLSCFNMKMIAYDPYVTQLEADKYGVSMVESQEVFKRSDFVSNHLPITEGTKLFINRDRISLMQSGSFFINTARAATLDEDAIIDALRNRRIKGAAFDVYNEEPLPIDHPLLSLDNVILIPHLGGASLDVVNNHSKMVCEDIRLFCEGKQPLRLANRSQLKLT